MTTLIASYNSEGCSGRCDARCHKAKTATCTCICGGANHGKGEAQAMENTQRMAEGWVETWKKDHPEDKQFLVRGPRGLSLIEQPVLL